MVTVEKDGTTTIEMNDSEAHALRDTLTAAARTSSDPAWTLARLLAHAHGEPGKES